MIDALAPGLRAQIARLRGWTIETLAIEVPPALDTIARVRFDGPIVLREPTLLCYEGLRFEPFAAPRQGQFFAAHAVFGLARSEDVAVWARVDGPSRDPLVCVRENDEDDDDFDAIETEGRLFRPLSEVLERASIE